MGMKKTAIQKSISHEGSLSLYVIFAPVPMKVGHVEDNCIRHFLVRQRPCRGEGASRLKIVKFKKQYILYKGRAMHYYQT